MMTLTPDDVRNATFRSRKRGKRGYDETEVDAFLDRVEAALRGEGTLTAEQILHVEFSPRRRGRRAYVEGEVDALLDAAAQTLQEREQRVLPTRQREQHRVPAIDRFEAATEQVRPASFAAPAQRPASMQTPASPQEPAYDADQVDAFLNRVEATLRGEDTLTAQDLLTVKFAQARPGGRACSKSGVDAFLIQVALSLKQLSGHAPRGHRASPPSPAAAAPRLTAASPLVAAELQDLTFSCPPPGYPAYDQRQVDAFLRRVEATLRGEDLLTSHEVAAVRFSPPPPGTRGYAEAEVEALLDLVQEHLKGTAVRGA